MIYYEINYCEINLSIGLKVCATEKCLINIYVEMDRYSDRRQNLSSRMWSRVRLCGVGGRVVVTGLELRLAASRRGAGALEPSQVAGTGSGIKTPLEMERTARLT